jgi:microcystin-dependent protein
MNSNFIHSNSLAHSLIPTIQNILLGDNVNVTQLDTEVFNIHTQITNVILPYLVQPGTIVAFNSVNAPTGWLICDGSNGTPDLRGRFIMQRGSGAGLTTRTFGQSGGTETHTLITDEIPSHTHTGTTDADGNHNHGGSTGAVNNFAPGNEQVSNIGSGATVLGNENDSHSHSISDSGTHTHGFTSNATGGGSAHAIMNPYYVLTYIMKT